MDLRLRQPQAIKEKDNSEHFQVSKMLAPSQKKMEQRAIRFYSFMDSLDKGACGATSH